MMTSNRPAVAVADTAGFAKGRLLREIFTGAIVVGLALLLPCAVAVDDGAVGAGGFSAGALALDDGVDAPLPCCSSCIFRNISRKLPSFLNEAMVPLSLRIPSTLATNVGTGDGDGRFLRLCECRMLTNFPLNLGESCDPRNKRARFLMTTHFSSAAFSHFTTCFLGPRA